MTYQFKIQINNIVKPPVWRRIIVPSNFTFFMFHAVIQITFGWLNDHMFLFSPQGHRSYPQIKLKFDDDLDDNWGFDRGEILNAEETKLSEIFTEEKQKYTYIYDFGDDWHHLITIEKIMPETTMYPRLLAGKGHCPPEDCGGPWGYEDMKQIMANSRHPKYKSYAKWIGLGKNETWDPTLFNVEENQKLLTEVFINNKFS